MLCQEGARTRRREREGLGHDAYSFLWLNFLASGAILALFIAFVAGMSSSTATAGTVVLAGLWLTMALLFIIYSHRLYLSLNVATPNLKSSAKSDEGGSSS